MFLHSKQRSKPAAGQEVCREGVHVPGREWEQKHTVCSFHSPDYNGKCEDTAGTNPHQAVPLCCLNWEHHLLQLVGKEQQLQRATLVPGAELRGASRSLPFDYLGKEALLSQPAGRETGLWF